jgi:hypothetical protein
MLNLFLLLIAGFLRSRRDPLLENLALRQQPRRGHGEMFSVPNCGLEVPPMMRVDHFLLTTTEI